MTENQPPRPEHNESSSQQPSNDGGPPEPNAAGQPGPPQHPHYPHAEPGANLGWGHSAPSFDPAVPNPWGHIPPPHPNSQLAYVLGIVGLIGTVCCCFLFFLPPIAWVLGHNAVKAIDAQPHMYSGREKARAGMIFGMVGTAAAIFGVFVFFLSFGLEMFIADW